LAQGPSWQTMMDDGVGYENSPFVYSVKRG
jgi:hypothetical protein